MDSSKGVSRTLSLLDTLIDSQYKDAPGDESTDRENQCKASTAALAVKNPPGYFHFEKLPLELRNRIYEFSLCRGKVFVKSHYFCDGKPAYSDEDLKGKIMPWPAHDFRGKRRPRYMQWEEIKYETSPKYTGLLLGVSKSVQKEAEQVFYGPKNHFVLPIGLYPFPDMSGENYVDDEDDSFELPPFKSISYTFDMRDVHQEAWTLREQMKEIELGEPEKGDNFEKLGFSSEDIMSEMHDYGKMRLDDLWEQRCKVMRGQLALKFLQIDLEECYCPTGCCRMALDVCFYLGPFTLGFPEKFEVIGVRNKAEAANIRRIIASPKINNINPSDIRCVGLDGQSIDYDASAPKCKLITTQLRLL